MKKALILLLTVLVVITGLDFSSNAAVIEEPGIMPCYNNANTISVDLGISNTGKATINLQERIFKYLNSKDTFNMLE